MGGIRIFSDHASSCISYCSESHHSTEVKSTNTGIKFGFSSTRCCLLTWPSNLTLPSFSATPQAASGEIKHMKSLAWTGHIKNTPAMLVPSCFIPTVLPSSGVLQYLARCHTGKNHRNSNTRHWVGRKGMVMWDAVQISDPSLAIHPRSTDFLSKRKGQFGQ